MTAHKQPEGVEGELEKVRNEWLEKCFCLDEDLRKKATFYCDYDKKAIAVFWLDKCREFYHLGIKDGAKDFLHSDVLNSIRNDCAQ